MNDNTTTDIEPGIEDGAVNVYQGDMADEFPVLKAFQQYIDAEQAKSRKRVLLLCLFFSIILMIVVGVFVGLLIVSTARNQSLNDRLVKYAMEDRNKISVPQPPQQDDSLLRDLSEKFETLQKAFAEDRKRLEEKVAEDRERIEKKIAEETAAKKKTHSAEALEIERLKALLAAEKEKTSAEREKQRQAELEAYRRKHYPECYYSPKLTISPSQNAMRNDQEADETADDREIDSILRDVKAVRYFDDEDDEEMSSSAPSRKKTKKDVVPSKDDVEIPDGIKDPSGNTWGAPEE